MTAPRHFSPTQSNLFAKCPEAYRRRYIEGEIIPPGFALVRGSAAHRGVEHTLRTKREKGVLPPLGDVLDAVRDEANARWQGGVLLTPEETAEGHTNVKGRVIDEAITGATLYHGTVAPNVAPHYIEAKLTADVSGLSRPLLGYADVITKQDGIRDTKFVSKTPDEDAAARSVQLTWYAFSYKVATGIESPVQVLDHIVLLKRGAKHEPRAVQNTRNDFPRLIRRIESQLLAIDAGTFPPAVPDAWWCSPRWCGYHATCPYVRRGGMVSVGAVAPPITEVTDGSREADPD